MTALLAPLLVPLALLAADDPTPDDNDVVAGWTAFAVFLLLIVAVVVISRSLVTRLRNVDRAAEAGKYDPSSPKKQREREARGLAAARQLREQRDAEERPDEETPPA